MFAIIQGGLDARLRSICIAEMVKRNTPGYAIGGLSGGEEKDSFWRVVDQCTGLLPPNKPRYCMGVGFAVDLVVCTALGVDMFDCVFPTRTAVSDDMILFVFVLLLSSIPHLPPNQPPPPAPFTSISLL